VSAAHPRAVGFFALIAVLVVGGAWLCVWQLDSQRPTAAAHPERQLLSERVETRLPAEPLEAPAEEVSSRRHLSERRHAHASANEDQATASLRMRARMRDRMRSENWARVYASFSAEDLTKERDRIGVELVAMTRAEFDRRFAAGEGELRDRTSFVNARTSNPFEICQLRGPLDGPWRMIVLPEDEFPRAYEQKALYVWLSEESLAMTRVAAR